MNNSLNNCYSKHFEEVKDFFFKKAVALCIRETDSLEMWRVFAHFFEVLEAMTAPLSKGG